MKRKYIDEAKFRDVVPQYMQKAVKHGDKALDLEVPEKNPIIPNIKKEITDQKLLSVIKEQIIKQNSKNIIKQLRKTKFAKSELVDYLTKINVLKNINHNVSDEDDYLMVDEIRKILSKEYYLIKNFQTLEISNNKTSLYNFLTHCEKNNFNLSYTSQDLKSEEKTINGIINGITNLTLIVNNNKLKKAYIYISDKPIDVLNMSVSCFFNSCQNLYNGSHNQKLLNNVFDKNMKVCYMIYDEPFIDQAGNKVNYTPLSRNIIRYIETLYKEKGEFYLDRTYGVLDSDLIKNYINNNLGFKVTTNTTETYHGTAVKGLSLPYLDNGLKAKFLTPDGLEVESETFEEALADFLGVKIVDEPEPNVYIDNDGDKYEVYEHDSLYDSFYRDNFGSYYDDFAENKKYINQFLDKLEWNEDNINDNFDSDEIRQYIIDNLEYSFNDLNLFTDIFYNEKIFNINGIIKNLYNGNRQNFINDLKKYTEFLELDRNIFPFEYLNYYQSKPYKLYELLNRHYLNYSNNNEKENEFYLNQKENMFYEIRLPGPNNDFFIKNLLYTVKAIAKKENNSEIIELCDKIKKLYKSTFYFEKANILVVPKGNNLSNYIYRLNLYLYSKRKKYKYPIAFYLSYNNNNSDILDEDYINLLKEKVKEKVLQGKMINIINDYVTELYGYSNLIQYIDFTGNSSKYSDYITELVSNTIYEYSAHDILAYETILGDFEFENNTYYVVKRR
jgi:hypothetical protein